jgi:hypothetical protein
VLLLVLVLALVCRRVLLCLQQCSSSRLEDGRACRIRLRLQLLQQQCMQKLAVVSRP